MGENSESENFIEYMLANKVKQETIDLLVKDGMDDLDLITMIDQGYIKKMKINTGQTLALSRAISQLTEPKEKLSRKAPENPTAEDAGDIAGGSATPVDTPVMPENACPTGNTITTTTSGDELSALLSQLKESGLLGDQGRNVPARAQGKEKPLLVQDFVHSLSGYTSGQEREVLSLGGDQRLLVSSARRVSPENTTLPQWIRGHLRIQDELIDRGELVCIADIKSYAKYGQKIADMCALYPLGRVMRFDAEYRIKVFEGALKWGDADPELMNFCVFVQFANNASAIKPRKRDLMPSDPASGKEICRNFNLQKGCQLKQCKFAHVCAKCHQSHPEFRHA